LDILERIFGRRKNEAWLEFCGQIGGDYAEGRPGQGDRVVAHFGKWTIALDSLEVAAPPGGNGIYTRMWVPYVSKDGFRFRIHRKGFLHEVSSRFFNAREVATGDPDFDQQFIVEGNSESRIRTLLANPRVRQLIRSQPSIDLKVRHDMDGIKSGLPDGVDQLYFEESGIIRDIERLKSLYALFTEILINLYSIGSVSEDEPKFAL
jgi:hypothetical protein